MKMRDEKMKINTFLEHKEKDTPNIANLKSQYKAISGRNFPVVTLTDNPTWDVCPGFPYGKVYNGMDEVFGKFYVETRKVFYWWKAEPEVWIDGGDVVTVLGYYAFMINEGDPIKRTRLSHTWKIASDGRFEGVWQIADSYVIQECLNARQQIYCENSAVDNKEINGFLEHKEENTQSIALLKEFYAGRAVNSVTGTVDMDVISKMFAAEPIWHVCPGFPAGGTYQGVDDVFGLLYMTNMPKLYSLFYCVPEVFIDCGDVVTVLGFYHFAINKGDPVKKARCAHTWKIALDGRIEGVWQVADSYVIQKYIKADLRPNTKADMERRSL
jgi:hypothetical protein